LKKERAVGFSPFRQTGLTHSDSRSVGGYTLVTPIAGDSTFLLDDAGCVVHRWQPTGVQPGYGYLLPGSHLLLVGVSVSASTARLGALVELDWEGHEVWRWEQQGTHHDMCRLANGNTLALVLEPVPESIAARVKGGLSRDQLTAEQQQLLSDLPVDMAGLPPGLLSDAIWEVTPRGDVIHVWHAYDHLDPEQDVICPLELRRVWTWANACQTTSNGDVLVSFRYLDTVACLAWPEGKLRWKFGRGVLSHQHDPSLTPTGTLLVFDNGTHHPVMQRTRVVEFNTETWQLVWEYRGTPEFSFSSGHISGCERLANGNTLICEGQTGRVFEVTPEGEMCWEWVTPFLHKRRGTEVTQLFRAHRYASDAPELEGARFDRSRYETLNRELGLLR
jgi:hypothetical protein